MTTRLLIITSLIAALFAHADMAEDLAALTKNSHRLTGTNEAHQAADYIEQRLRQAVSTDTAPGIGSATVLVQPFVVPTMTVLRCDLALPDGKSLPLLPMRPNGVMPPVTPLDGITGQLLHAGMGRPEDYGNQDPRGKIIVLGYAAAENWRLAFRFGAAAVIFTHSQAPTARQFHYLNANANFPRFFYDGPTTDLVDGTQVTVNSQIIWEPAKGQNIIAIIPGTGKPLTDEQQEAKAEAEAEAAQTGQPLVLPEIKPEYVLLSAPYDSYGEVPHRSPAARSAANVAALLDIAEQLRRDPPQRHTIIAFFDGQAKGHLGASAFYRAIQTRSKDATVQKRQEYADNETQFITELNRILATDKPLMQESTARQELLLQTKAQAAEHVFDLTYITNNLREEREALIEGSKAYNQLNQKLDDLLAEKQLWNTVRRILAKQTFEDAEIKELILTHIIKKTDFDIPQVPGQSREDRDKAIQAARDQALAETLPIVRSLLKQVLAEVGANIAERKTELDAERHGLTVDTQLNQHLIEKDILLHLSLSLGDQHPRWGLIVGGTSIFHSVKDSPGLYNRIQLVFNDAAQQDTFDAFEISSVNGDLMNSSILFAHQHLVHSGEIAGQLGIFNATLGTVQDPFTREGTPADTTQNLDLPVIATQATQAARLLRHAFNHPDLTQKGAIQADGGFHTSEFADNHVLGSMAMARTRGSSMPNQAVPHAAIKVTGKIARNATYPVLYTSADKVAGFDNYQTIMSNYLGGISYGPLWNQGYNTTAFAIKFTPDGLIQFVSDLSSEAKMHLRLDMFTARHGALMLPIQVEGQQVALLDGKANSALNKAKAYFDSNDGTVYWYSEEKVDTVKAFGLRGTVALVNGPLTLNPEVSKRAIHEESALGIGMDQEEGWHYPATGKRAAADLWRLNESRLAIMRSRGVSNRSLEELHGHAEDGLLAAQETDNLATAESISAAAFLSQHQLYENVRKLLDDLVKAVLVLLALSVPFAYALERLIIGAPTIYKQILWFCSFFIATFLLLFFSHPAFAISKTPAVIFLGFTIIVLASLVIVIIMRKFEVELKIIQGMESTVHNADISRFGTIIAAMNMGIASMRRRPLRTTLTAVTIILLTFTILCFASFDAQLGIIKRFVAPNPGYTGITLHQVTWQELSPDLEFLISGQFPDDSLICPRYWRSVSPTQDIAPLVTRDDGSTPVSLRGFLGIDHRELGMRTDINNAMGNPTAEQLRDGIWLPPAVAERLNVQPGQSIILNGHHLTVQGILDPLAVTLITDLDNTAILPVDFTQASSSTGDDTVAMDDSSWTALPVDSCVIVGTQTARDLGAAIHVLVLYTYDASKTVEIAENLARIMPFPVNATRADGVYRHILGSQVAASGARDLIFPILLGGLVIFGTMLGSVADREKEIYTFSALGLAPQHVAGLFFAEAIVYSVIGGLGGYLMAQGTLKALGLLAEQGLVRIPEMNYSSTNAIVTILLVMVTVMISAIYPAIKASKSANPGVMRNWKLPLPTGDLMDIAFPFTVSGYDITGVVSFLKEHFDSFSDVGLGVFMSKDCKLIKHNGQVGIEANIALAPFDLGVTETFVLFSAPSEIEGIDEVNIKITRLSGQHKDWQRLNRVLLEDLRKQFLIWRSLPAETMEGYRQNTLATLGSMTDSEPHATTESHG